MGGDGMSTKNDWKSLQEILAENPMLSLPRTKEQMQKDIVEMNKSTDSIANAIDSYKKFLSES